LQEALSILRVASSVRYVDSLQKFAIISTGVCYQLSGIGPAPVAQSDRATDFLNLRFIDSNDKQIRLQR